MKNQKSSFKILITVGVTLLIFVGIFAVIKTSDVSLDNDVLKVKGIYGISIPISEIGEVKKLDTLPSSGGRRVNGIGLGSIKIGYFSYSDLGRVRLCVLKKEAPYILVTSNTEMLIIGLGKEKNEKLYDNLISKMN